jgi:hypothetical protein
MAKNLFPRSTRDFFTEFNIKTISNAESEEDYQIDDPFELLNDEPNDYEEDFEFNEILFDNENLSNTSIETNVFQVLDNIK